MITLELLRFFLLGLFLIIFTGPLKTQRPLSVRGCVHVLERSKMHQRRFSLVIIADN
jgi:hypothetical protein